MATGYRYYWVTYEEAQRMRAIIDLARDKANLPRDVRERLSKIKMELGRVRDMDYGALPGGQIILSEGDGKVYETLYDLYQQGILT